MRLKKIKIVRKRCFTSMCNTVRHIKNNYVFYLEKGAGTPYWRVPLEKAMYRYVPP